LETPDKKQPSPAQRIVRQSPRMSPIGSNKVSPSGRNWD